MVKLIELSMTNFIYQSIDITNIKVISILPINPDIYRYHIKNKQMRDLIVFKHLYKPTLYVGFTNYDNSTVIYIDYYYKQDELKRLVLLIKKLKTQTSNRYNIDYKDFHTFCLLLPIGCYNLRFIVNGKLIFNVEIYFSDKDYKLIEQVGLIKYLAAKHNLLSELDWSLLN